MGVNMMVQTQNAAGLQDLLVWDVMVQEPLGGTMDVDLPVCFLWGARQISLCKLFLNWAVEMSCCSTGALHDPVSILDLNVRMGCTSQGFRVDEMLLAVEDLGNVLLCLKTFLLQFT